MGIAQAQQEFAPGLVYLDSASMGLPPRRAISALTEELARWAAGRSSAPNFDASVERARASYAALVGVATDRVAVGSQASVFVGLVAAAVPDGSEVLTVGGEFTSVTFPFFAQAGRGVRVREVPLEELTAAVSERIALVAVSAVQSADGRMTDLDALAAATEQAGVPVLLDVTQAVGWLPVSAARFAYTVCGGYKWLLAPRGTCFFTVAGDAADALIPHNAGWYAGDSRWDSIYGGPLRLAGDARRFDVSPAWHSWVGQAESLDLLSAVGVPALHEHAVGLANRFRSSYGRPYGNSAIVSVDPPTGSARRLDQAGIRASLRAGRLRLAFHLYNTEDDVDRTVAALLAG